VKNPDMTIIRRVLRALGFGKAPDARQAGPSGPAESGSPTTPDLAAESEAEGDVVSAEPSTRPAT